MTGHRWAYVGAGLGVAASVGANIAHALIPARVHVGAVLGAAFWPVAVVVALEVLTRIDWPDGRRWLLLRFGGLAPVAAVAAVVSYRHLSGLLAYWSEDPVTVAIGPLAVDGLMVLCSAALMVEPSRRRTTRRAAVTGMATPPKRSALADPPSTPSAVEPSMPPPVTVAAKPVAVQELVPLGQAVAADLAAKGKPLTRRALIEGLRARGATVGTDRAGELLRSLRGAGISA